MLEPWVGSFAELSTGGASTYPRTPNDDSRSSYGNVRPEPGLENRALSRDVSRCNGRAPSGLSPEEAWADVEEDDLEVEEGEEEEEEIGCGASDKRGMTALKGRRP